MISSYWDSEISGFNVAIYYDDDTSLKLPSDEQIDIGLDIAEPVDGEFYYIFKKNVVTETTSSTQESTSKSEENGTPFIYQTLFLIVPLVMLRRKKLI